VKLDGAKIPTALLSALKAARRFLALLASAGLSGADFASTFFSMFFFFFFVPEIFRDVAGVDIVQRSCTGE
jgi:hypothetical protein